MNITVVVLALLALTQATKTESSSSKNTNALDGKSEKRELAEGNAAIGKRAPVPSPVSPTTAAGIEYADTRGVLSDKSPNQQVYSTPQPQLAKISDLLTGQGPPYQAAIASHLYSPVSIYQPRVSSPTTYEISPPIPSQLAYSEHKVSIPNIIQYNIKPQKSIKQNLVNYDENYEQSLPIQKLFQQIPNNPYFQPLQYNGPIQISQQVPYQQIIPQNAVYPQEQGNGNLKYQQVEQRDLKNQPAPIQLLNKQYLQVTNTKPQNALSYATFIYNPVDSPNGQYTQQIPNQIQLQSTQIEQQQIRELIPQYQHQIQSQQQIQPLPQIQYQLQHPLQTQPGYQNVARLEPLQTQYQQEIQPQRFVIQPQQIQNKIQPQYQIEAQRLQQYNIDQQAKTFPRQAILKPEAVPQTISGPYHSLQIRNIGNSQLLSPTFPSVQYFGKFANTLFGGYQHQ